MRGYCNHFSLWISHSCSLGAKSNAVHRTSPSRHGSCTCSHVLPRHILGRPARLHLLQRRDHLRFRVPASANKSSPFLRPKTSNAKISPISPWHNFRVLGFGSRKGEERSANPGRVAENTG